MMATPPEHKKELFDSFLAKNKGSATSNSENDKGDPFGMYHSRRNIKLTIDLDEQDAVTGSNTRDELSFAVNFNGDPFGMAKRSIQTRRQLKFGVDVPVSNGDPFGIALGKMGFRSFGITIDGEDGNQKNNILNDQLFERGNSTNEVGDDGGDPFNTVNKRRKKRKVKGIEVDMHEEIQAFGGEETCVYDESDDYKGSDCSLTISSPDDNGMQHTSIQVGMVYETVEECEALYMEHARMRGFSTRRRKKLTDANGTIVVRSWVCSKEGQREENHPEREDRMREPRALTRCRCLAQLYLKLDKNLKKYVVRDFNDEHNHSMVSFDETHLLRSHRKVGLPDKSQIDGMRKVGIKCSHIMDYIVAQSGGFENVGFTGKDLYNYVNETRRAILKVGDAQSAIAYLDAKIDADPMFFYRYTKDNKKRLQNLYWSDGRSRDDYAHFGDVIAFDTTYKTNAYRKPFVILVGVNHHHHTIIFGCALLVDESECSYKWVLKTFLEAMNNKSPISVVTDGDKSMRNAITQCFPNARHRLCSWHLHRNSMTNVHVEGFSSQFQKCMAMWYTPDEFEKAWKDMVNNYEVQKNPWIEETYAKRTMWAEAHLRGQFFAGMRSTQRCEGMNSFFNRFLGSTVLLFEFVRHYDRAVTRLRQRELKEELESKNASPVLTNALQSLEKHGAEIYTLSSFKRFRDELKYETLYSVVEKVENASGQVYKLAKYCDDISMNEVRYGVANKRLECSCQRLESNGIPCRHILAVLKAENVKQIPECCIYRRWCKDAKSGVKPLRKGFVPNDELAVTARFGALNAACNNLSYIASQSKQLFEIARGEIDSLACRMEEHYQYSSPKAAKSKSSSRPIPEEIIDPETVTTKGRPAGSGHKLVKKPRRCGSCRCIGHTKPHCPKLVRTSKNIKLETNNEGNEQFEQNNKHSTDGEEEKEDEQWIYSSMESPVHRYSENSGGAREENVDEPEDVIYGTWPHPYTEENEYDEKTNLINTFL